MDNTEIKSVLFTRRHAPYNPGQIAGFLAPQADAFVKAGFAKHYVEGETPIRKDITQKMVKKS